MSEKQKELRTEPKSNNQTSSYRSIFKATSLFGGVQVYQILIQIIKSKFVAILLGPTGVGINGLYTSATSLIRELSSFGLSSSAIRDVSSAYAEGDNNKINKTVTVSRRLFWVTGILGMILVIVLSPLLSKTTFGSYAYIVPLIIVSVTLLLDQLSAGQKVLLQGTRKLKYLAKSSAIGATVGLLVSVPMYYLWGLKAIVPAIIIHSITTLALSAYYSNKLSFKKVKLSFKETYKEGSGMMKMGVAMALSGIMVTSVAYILRSYISNTGGLEEVGLFAAAHTIMTTYTALIFKAMGTDFYPRLAAVSNDNNKCNQLINQQGEIGILIMAPILIACIVFAPIVIQILYSEKFLLTNGYIVWASSGMLFKMASWAMSYAFIAKGDSKEFMKNEVIANSRTLILNILGYMFGGLTGLGASFAITYFLYMLQLYVKCRKQYEFRFAKSFYTVFLLQMFMIVLSVACYLFIKGLIVYFIGTLIIFISGYISYKGLDKRMDISDLVLKKFKSK